MWSEIEDFHLLFRQSDDGAKVEFSVALSLALIYEFIKKYMNKKNTRRNKVIITFLGLATLGTGAGAAAIASAATTTTTNDKVQVTQNAGGKGTGFGRRGPPGVIGRVTTVSGNSITVTDKSGTVYTVLLANAKITKNVGGSQPTTITAADITIGDTIGVRGTISGSSVAATFVMDGISVHGVRGHGQDGKTQPSEPAQ